MTTGRRYIEVFKTNNFQDKSSVEKTTKEKTFGRELQDDEEEEDVAESGRLFVRNLPYTCTEDDLKELFTKHGGSHDVFLRRPPSMGAAS